MFILGLGLEWIYGLIKLRLGTVIAAGLAFIHIPLATDLATAMVLVRNQRSDISAADLLAYTFEKIQDKEALAYRRLFVDGVQ